MKKQIEGKGIWPPAPDVIPTIVEKEKKYPFLHPALIATGIIGTCLLLLLIVFSIYMHFELLRECGNRAGGFCS